MPPKGGHRAVFEANVAARQARNVRIFAGDSRSVVPSLSRRYGVILVDGDHAYATVLADLRNSCGSAFADGRNGVFPCAGRLQSCRGFSASGGAPEGLLSSGDARWIFAAGNARNNSMPSEPLNPIGCGPRNVSVVIPTYRRGEALLRTLELLLRLDPPPVEILVVDQTEQHPSEVDAKLQRMESAGRIRIFRFSPPSIPRAMNVGLREAAGEVVLFLDDDVEPAPGLVAAHAARHGGPYAAVCGQVLQPGEFPDPEANRGPRRTGFLADLDFRFNGTKPAEIRNVMAGNLSVARETALAIGGFDEQFIGSAYRFETDFARRLIAAGHRILFAPDASLRHLRLDSGGTRSGGDHLERPTPRHAVGDYYFAFSHARGLARWTYVLRRFVRESCSRYYLKRPWRVVRKLAAEFQAFALARHLVREGPRRGGEA